MNEIKKGQTVWITTRRGIKETTVKSVGSKYITVEHNKRIKFHKNTLKEVDACGVADTIILDLDEHNKAAYYNALINKLEKFNWNTVSRDDLEKIENIIKNY